MQDGYFFGCDVSVSLSAHTDESFSLAVLFGREWRERCVLLSVLQKQVYVEDYLLSV